MFNYATDDFFGTELMGDQIKKHILPNMPKLTDYKWFIVPGRFIKPDNKTIMYNHIEHTVPAVQKMLDKSFTDKFLAFVFVSHWQQRKYVERFGLDESKCYVLKNAIDPIEPHKKPKTDKVRLIYFSDHARGLSVLLDAFKQIDDSDIELHIYREPDFIEIPKDDRITLHGKVKPKAIKEALKQTHIFAYPCTHEETSCISLMEAMSAGCYCLTSNYAALPETGMNLIHQYPYVKAHDQHVTIFKKELLIGIDKVRSGWQSKLQIEAANQAFSWENRKADWQDFYDKITAL
jgi:glycosyltransferase involved in cell wall biosynthesis